jgi:hypothetical protein
MEITLKLTVEEINSILNMLGQMQNSSGTYPLLMKIRQQGLEQVNQASAPVDVVTQ